MMVRKVIVWVVLPLNDNELGMLTACSQTYFFVKKSTAYVLTLNGIHQYKWRFGKVVLTLLNSILVIWLAPRGEGQHTSFLKCVRLLLMYLL